MNVTNAEARELLVQEKNFPGLIARDKEENYVLTLEKQKILKDDSILLRPYLNFCADEDDMGILVTYFAPHLCGKITEA